MIKEFEVSNIAEYIQVVNEIRCLGYNFYRGQDSFVEHKMLPSLLREDIKTKRRIYSNNCDNSFMNSFKSRAVACINFTPQNDWEWMSTAQHYGLPTRMLDWSQSALSALFFAVENEEFEYNDENDTSIIWCLNPIELNEKTRFVEDYTVIPNIIEQNEVLQQKLQEKFGIGKSLAEIIYPIALICPASNGRINAQKGTFTLFPLNAKPLEEMEDMDDVLVKIKLARDSKKEIKKQLFEIGITYSNIYPDLDYVCKDIKYEYQKNS